MKRLLFWAVIAVAAYFGWDHWAAIHSAVTHYFAAPAATGRGARGAGPAPVVAAYVTRGDVHIYLSAQGTVTPFKTVTLRTRVDGQIISIAFHEGQVVHEKDPLLEIDPRPFQVQLDQARGQFLKDEATLKNAQIDLERYQKAYKNGGAVSDQQVATQQALVEQNQGTVISDQSQIDAANLQLIYCHVTAPITGRIGLRLVDVGNIVHASDAGGLAVITQLQPIALVFNLPEDDLNQLLSKPNGGAHLPVDAYDRDDVQKLASGVVEAVDNQVDPTNGTFKVKARFANENNLLFPNEFVNAHLLVDVLKNVVIAPTAAVQHGPQGGTFVYLVSQDQTVHIHSVTEGPSEGAIESIEGLNVGDRVVTDGTDKLQDGAKVSVSMADASGEPTTQPATRASTRPGGRGRGGNRSASRRNE